MREAWSRLRAVPSWILPLLVGILALLLPTLGSSYWFTQQIQLACILALLTSGLNLSLGYAGEMALGQAAMYAAGAYTAGLLARAGVTDLIVQLLAAGAVALVVGVVSGIPGLRLNNWSLAMTSFFLVLLIPDVLSIFNRWTGGEVGLTGIPTGTIFGHMLQGNDLYVAMVAVTLLWFAIMRNLAGSRTGVALRVLKHSAVLASSSGISVFRLKLAAYAIGGFPAGMAGALLANLDQYLSPGAFSFTLAMSVLAGSVLGGSVSVYGAALGAAIIQFGPNQSSEFQQYGLVFMGAFLLVGGVLLRGGISELGRLALSRVDRWAGVRPSSRLPSGPEAAGALQLSGTRLSVDDLRKAFGGNQALRGVSLVASPGEVTAVIGPNGSGKTTLLNMMCGYYRTDDGVIAVDNVRLNGRSAHQVARAGVARTFQTPDVPAGLTVTEVVASGRYLTERTSWAGAVLRTRRYRAACHNDLAVTARALELVDMTELAGAEAASLPLGRRRMLEVARALVGQPKVLLLDEAASGLDEQEIEVLRRVVRRICADGVTVILVEHNFQLVLELADQIVVLAQGEVIASGAPAQIGSDARVISEYLGSEPATDTAARPLAPTGEV